MMLDLIWFQHSMDEILRFAPIGNMAMVAFGVIFTVMRVRDVYTRVERLLETIDGAVRNLEIRLATVETTCRLRRELGSNSCHFPQ
jgi:hypothetical protein